MAKNRRNQSASIRFGPAIKAMLLCLLFGGAAVGYVWQKTRVYELGRQIHERELLFSKLADGNKKLRDQLAMLRSPGRLEQRARELNLGLVPPPLTNIWRLPEPAEPVSRPVVAASHYAANQSRGEALR